MWRRAGGTTLKQFEKKFGKARNSPSQSLRTCCLLVGAEPGTS